MKKIIALILISQLAFSQTENKKIKVILLGTFHFGATSDRNSTKFDDLFTPKRQTELDTLAIKLAKNNITKIFVEDIPENQKEENQLYQNYITNKIIDEKTLKDEIVQVAFRIAKLTNSAIVCSDFKQELPYDKIEVWEKKHKKKNIHIHFLK